MFNDCAVIAEEKGLDRNRSILTTIGELVLEKEIAGIYIGCIKINENDYKHLFPSIKIDEEIDAFSNLYYRFCPYYFETHNVKGTLWGIMVVVTDEAEEGRIRLCGVGVKERDKEYITILKISKEGNRNAQGYKEGIR